MHLILVEVQSLWISDYASLLLNKIVVTQSAIDIGIWILLFIWSTRSTANECPWSKVVTVNDDWLFCGTGEPAEEWEVCRVCGGTRGEGGGERSQAGGPAHHSCTADSQVRPCLTCCMIKLRFNGTFLWYMF